MKMHIFGHLQQWKIVFSFDIFKRNHDLRFANVLTCLYNDNSIFCNKRKQHIDMNVNSNIYVKGITCKYCKNKNCS